MPRYFFHDVAGRRQRDTKGMSLPNIKAARIEAIAYAGQVLRDRPDKVWASGQWRVEVADEEGRLLFTLVTVAVDAPASEISG